jgi:hypothetical protein
MAQNLNTLHGTPNEDEADGQIRKSSMGKLKTVNLL